MANIGSGRGVRFRLSVALLTLVAVCMLVFLACFMIDQFRLIPLAWSDKILSHKEGLNKPVESFSHNDIGGTIEEDMTHRQWNGDNYVTHSVVGHLSAMIPTTNIDPIHETNRSNPNEFCLNGSCSPFQWSPWSPCSSACGRGHRYRKAIYEYSCLPHDNVDCPDHRIETENCGKSCLFDPEKYGGPDGLPLYPTNPLNPPIYPERDEEGHACGNWIAEYANLHRAILRGDLPPSYLVYSTGDGGYPSAGGLADRLRGITTIFYLAVLLERAFIIDWQHPQGLQDYLLPKYVDWSFPKTLQSTVHGVQVHDIGSWRAAKFKSISSQWYMNTNFSAYFSNPFEIIQGHRYDYTYAMLRNPDLMPKAYQLGVDRTRCRICCAFQLLFTVNPDFKGSIERILYSIGFPPQPYIALQYRAVSNDIKKELLLFEKYTRCARIVMKKELSRVNNPRPLLVPISNNQILIEKVAQRNQQEVKMLYLESNPSDHLHLGGNDIDVSVHPQVQNRTFQDFFIILYSPILIRSKGYQAAFGIVGDALRQHFNPRENAITYVVSDGTCTKQHAGSRIE